MASARPRLAPPNLILDVLDEPAKLGFGFDVFVPGEAHFGQVVLVLGADGVAWHEGPGRIVLVAEQPEAVGQGGSGYNVLRAADKAPYPA